MEKYLTKADILDTIKMLAQSQGIYSRLLANITDSDLQNLEEQHFSDALDLILYIEG